MVRLNRWFQVWLRIKPFLSTWSVYFTINVVLCLKMGHISDASDLQLFNVGEELEHVGAAPPAPKAKAASGRAGRGVKDSNQNIEALRMKCEDTVHMATEALGSRSSRALLVGLHSMISPVEERHSMDVSALKTVMGRQQINIKMGLGLRNEYIAQTLAPHFDLSVLVDCGI